jgi:hypothetical protein
MWGPRLKYHLRGPEEATRWSSLYLGSSMARARDAFLLCHHLDLLNLVATLSLVRVTWRGYAAPAPAYEL